MIVSKNISEAPGILGVLYRQYENNADKVVIQVGEEKLTYGEMVDYGTRIASAIYELGIREKDRVGILIENDVNWYVFLYAIVRLGAIAVPFDSQMGKYEMKYLFDKVGIRMLLSDIEFRGTKHVEIIKSLRDELLDLKNVIVYGEYECDDSFFIPFEKIKCHDIIELPDISVEREDSNIFICTTGSTGNPKIVDIPCRIINDNIEKNNRYFGFEEGARFFLTMPLFHAAGFGWGLSCLSAGGSIYYDVTFSPTRLLERIQNEKITKLLSTPTLMKILLSHKRIAEYDLSSLDQIIFTGEFLSDELMSRFADDYGIRVTNALGMTETFVFLVWDSERDREFPANQFDKVPDIEIKLTDAERNEVETGSKGLINIKNSVMKQYYRLEDVTKETISPDGWLNSGDLGTVTEKGRIVFSGREKRVIKRGGNLVSPEEIEQFLKTYPTVAAVVIDNEPDAIIGEKIIAYIQPTIGDKVTKEELLKFCKGNISAFKIPDVFHFIKEVPKSVGKVNQTKLKQLISEGKIEFLY